MKENMLKSDSVTKFEISLNRQNKTYSPGQYIEGHVNVKTDTPFHIKGIVLQFCGRAEVCWTEKISGVRSKFTETTGRQYRASEEFFNTRYLIFEPGLLQTDTQPLPFKFHLMSSLPDSYLDNICEIEYFVEARLKLDHDITHDIVDRSEILMVDPIDLNKIVIPDVTFPVHTQKKMDIRGSCCKSGALIIGFLRLVRSGYSPGEIIHVQADVENDSSSNIRNVTFILYEERIYLSKQKTHIVHNVISRFVKGPVNAKTTEEWSDIPLEVPRQQVFNMSACSIFDIKHTLEMMIRSGSTSEHLTIHLPVVLGSIPLKSVSQDMLQLERFHQKSSVEQLREKQAAIESIRRHRAAYLKEKNLLNNTVHQEKKRRNKVQPV